ncbi:MAG: GerW family sporulation protein [Acutalibacteraceae bacterium]|nr:GerW family sporulation protein [Acutalibacteraceae bacterium]
MNNESNLMKVLSFTADKTIELANSNSVMGEKITVDGITVIPVSKISVGFAGGGADLENAAKKSTKSPAGAGAKVDIIPMTFLVIENNEAKLVTLEQPQKKDNFDNIIKSVVEKVKQIKTNGGK